jgi:hypothetical protein
MLRSTLATMTIALTLVACPRPEDKETSDDGADAGETGTSGGQASAGTGPETPAPSERPESIPLLCSFEGGKWCTGCPQGSAGPLCCAGETCVPWDPAGVACDGVVGWCSNYSTALKFATCHD